MTDFFGPFLALAVYFLKRKVRNVSDPKFWLWKLFLRHQNGTSNGFKILLLHLPKKWVLHHRLAWRCKNSCGIMIHQRLKRSFLPSSLVFLASVGRAPWSRGAAPIWWSSTPSSPRRASSSSSWVSFFSLALGRLVNRMKHKKSTSSTFLLRGSQCFCWSTCFLLDFLSLSALPTEC